MHGGRLRRDAGGGFHLAKATRTPQIQLMCDYLFGWKPKNQMLQIYSPYYIKYLKEPLGEKKKKTPSHFTNLGKWSQPIFRKTKETQKLTLKHSNITS